MTQTPKKHPRSRFVAGIRNPHFDPHEAYNPIPWQVTAILLALMAWGIVTLVTDSQLSKSLPHIGQETDLTQSRATASDAASAPDGRQLFTDYCSTCHQANGAGIANAVPPLSNSHYVQASAKVPVNILLFGITGEIEVNGSAYNGRMPAFGHNLDDEQIASILNYVRDRWGNMDSAIEPGFVAEQRQRFSERAKPWEGGKALDEAFDIPASTTSLDYGEENH